ncbi:unnamed protein product [Ambrosiozyma monospora]|uniref:Unnamed protein product n=1 Tax=Ambrosiozyma monospora TaxID=43982 RepID=A0ACB5SUX5_AMBMO|nr:unnamed protein product [Ambrosiozyma monospora]
MSESEQSFFGNVNLKCLYTFDDTTNFLARSNKPIKARIMRLPPQAPHSGSLIGCIDLHQCLSLIMDTSPERFQKSSDYSIYSKDVIEPDEPLVGFGLFSKIQAKRNAVVIPGRICKSFMSFYGGSGSDGMDTLEVKLRFNSVAGTTNTDVPSTSAMTGPSSNPVPISRKRPVQQLVPSDDYSPPSQMYDSEDNYNNYTTSFQEPPLKRRARSIINNDGPQLAARTQSLPFLSQNSLHHRILLSDMNSGSQQAQGPKRDDVSSRFSTLSKFNKQKKIKRTSKNYIKGVVNVGDPKEKDPVIVQKCINCLSTTNPPYKFYREGIFEFGNSGLLCSVCNSYQMNEDMENLRHRGSLGARGLLDGAMAKNISRRSKSSKSASSSDSSSPAIVSSPLTAVAEAKSKSITSKKKKSTGKRNRNNSNNNNNSSNNHSMNTSSSENNMNHMNNQSRSSGTRTSFGGSLDEMMRGSTPDFIRDDNVSSIQHPLTDIDPVFQSTRRPLPVSRQQQQQQQQDEPINATKLNTTLIPLGDDDEGEVDPENEGEVEEEGLSDKENVPPPRAEQRPSVIREEVEVEPQSLLGHDISPSIQRIINSFHAAASPGSPTKESPNKQWMTELFTHLEDGPENEDEELDVQKIIDESKSEARQRRQQQKQLRQQQQQQQLQLQQQQQQQQIQLQPLSSSSVSGSGSGNSTTPMKFEKTPKDKFTPVDPGTTQTETIDNGETPSATNTNSNNNNNTSQQNQQQNPQQQHMNNIPSSPYFTVHHDNEDDDDENDVDVESSRFMDTSRTNNDHLDSIVNWNQVSSPVTDPCSPSGSGSK